MSVGVHGAFRKWQSSGWSGLGEELKPRSCCRTGAALQKAAGRTSGPGGAPHTLLLSPPAPAPSAGAAACRAPLAVLPAASVAYIPPAIPVLLSRQQGGAPYAVYLQSPSAKPDLARPPPTSFAVRSMTFEDKAGAGPSARSSCSRADLSPLLHKRVAPASACQSSPPKVKRPDANSKVES